MFICGKSVCPEPPNLFPEHSINKGMTCSGVAVNVRLQCIDGQKGGAELLQLFQALNQGLWLEVTRILFPRCSEVSH